ncbi:MAG TPA: hypothetical protein ENH82_13350 [bacterium]|nr:hypothetical protein [bacterium]
MAEETGQERTERATDRRREETRKKGQVARSIEVNSAMILFASFGVLMLFGKSILTGISNIITGSFNISSSFDLSIPSTKFLFFDLILKYFIILMPVFIVLAIVGIFVNIIQVGFLFTGERNDLAGT